VILTEVNSSAYTEDHLLNSGIVSETIVPTRKKSLENKGGVFAVACMMGAVTALPTFAKTDNLTLPSLTDVYTITLGVQSFESHSSVFPEGYRILNKLEVGEYLKEHVSLKSFLENSLPALQAVSGVAEFGLEYEGLKDEGWESLYIIAYLDSDEEEYASQIENNLLSEWLLRQPDDIAHLITVTLDWK